MPTPQQVAEKIVTRRILRETSNTASVLDVPPCYHHDQAIDQLRETHPLGENYAADQLDPELAHDDFLDRLKLSIGHLRETREFVVRARRKIMNADTKPELQRLRDVQMLSTGVGQTIAEIDADKSEVLADLDKLLAATLPKPGRYDDQTLVAWRGLNPEQRHARLAALDRDEVAAVILAPPISSGLTREQHDGLIQQWRAKFFPVVLKRVERARLALELVDKTAADLYKFGTRELVDADRIRFLEAQARVGKVLRD